MVLRTIMGVVNLVFDCWIQNGRRVKRDADNFSINLTFCGAVLTLWRQALDRRRLAIGLSCCDRHWFNTHCMAAWISSWCHCDCWSFDHARDTNDSSTVDCYNATVL